MSHIKLLIYLFAPVPLPVIFNNHINLKHRMETIIFNFIKVLFRVSYELKFEKI